MGLEDIHKQSFSIYPAIELSRDCVLPVAFYLIYSSHVLVHLEPPLPVAGIFLFKPQMRYALGVCFRPGLSAGADFLSI